ncbi:hypothetical protein FRC11_012028, partial [Ceratobasidium sp. 423]
SGDETEPNPTRMQPSLAPQESIDFELNNVVSSLMSCDDIIALLARHGCQNLTPLLLTETCSQYPIASGGFGDIYRGKLLEGRKVAIKTVRVFESYEPGKYHK